MKKLIFSFFGGILFSFLTIALIGFFKFQEIPIRWCDIVVSENYDEQFFIFVKDRRESSKNMAIAVMNGGSFLLPEPDSIVFYSKKSGEFYMKKENIFFLIDHSGKEVRFVEKTPNVEDIKIIVSGRSQLGYSY